MTVKTLCLSGFRNLTDSVFSPCAGINVLYGENAQGKTNLIEALWLCTGSKSFRGAKDAEMIRLGQKNGRLEMAFEANGREQQIGLALDGGRKARLNGVALESPARLAGEFCAVIFSPEHLGLIKDGPAPRRKFIDAAICQLMPRHAPAAAEYQRILFQRNALLKDIPQHSELIDTLDIWDERLARAGAVMVFTRLRYLRRLAPAAASIYGGIAHGGEELGLAYESSEHVDYACPLEDTAAAHRILTESLRRAMTSLRASDIDAGYTHAGPHRDDLAVTVNGLSARSFASQGQQRSAALALKLAEAAVLREQRGEAPVLLLDDVLSELDFNRRDYLLNHIEGQVFITCCDPSGITGLLDGQTFRVSGGGVARTDIRAEKGG